jgi:hypothetical protein
MRIRFDLPLLLLCLFLATPALARVEITAEQAKQIRVRWVKGEATALAAGGDLGVDERSIFLISGEVENVSDQRIAWVKFRFDLLDAGYGVVASEYGYNRGAEALREPAVERGEQDPATLKIPAIEPRGADGFRMTFFKSEVPRFVRWRVKILEVKTASTR